MIGQTLSHFKITAKLGEGGMGEVYRAEDTKLGREVAIKLLPPAFTEDVERLARFEREAKVLASLNHPNIAGIFQLEEADGQQLLVMELVEGHDLSERLECGPLGIEEAAAIALQVAQGLEAAHERGVVHRDLKPANIKVTADGEVKILDFGLAKAWEESPEEGSLSMSPTLTAQMTQAGVILGTAPYMSPEQAKGQPADKRADIWSFGVLLWEMLTGRCLFAGDSVSDTLAAVLRDEIDQADLPDGTPVALRDLLARCLVRNPKTRLRDIGEARIVLEGPMDPGIRRPEPEPRAGRLEWKAAIPAAIVAAILAGLSTWAFISRTRSDSLRPAVLRVALPMPAGQRLPSPLEFPRIDISEDGLALAYSAFKNTTQAVYLQRLDSFDVTRVPGTEGGSGPVLSPDGKWIAFFVAETLFKVPIGGGKAQKVADRTVWDRDAVWMQDDTIIMGADGSDSSTGGLLAVPAAGGEVQRITEPEPGETHDAPTRLPDGSVLFGIKNRNGSHLGRLRPKTREWESLSIPGEKAWWLEGGFLVVAGSLSFEVYRFDLASGEVTGPPIDILPNAAGDTLAISPDGTAAYISEEIGGGDTVVVVDDRGAVTPLPIASGSFRWPRVSPDGTRLAIGVPTEKENESQLWIYELDSGRRTTLGPGSCGDSRGEPVWSPDGRQLVTSSGNCGLLIQPSDGSQPATVLFAPDFEPWPTDWSRDGKQIVFYGNSVEDDNQSIWLLDVGPEPSARLAVGGGGPQRLASFSPDGRWLAYTSRESGRNEVYVQPLPALDRRWTVSAAGGIDPKWAPDGRQLYYRNRDEVYVVPIETEPDFRPGTPSLLFSGAYQHDPNGDQSWDILPDGRFVFVLPDAEERRDLRVVVHLVEEVRRRLENR